MEDPIVLPKVKFNALFSFFNDLGYKTSTKIGIDEYRTFLNKNSKTGIFDPALANKLFEILNIDEISTISVEDFINGFLSFEEEVQKNAEFFNFKLAQEQEIYDKILKQCRAYQSEQLNSEGFCQNAKIYGEISDIDIKRKLEGIKEIIIIIIYNEKKEEIRFKIGDKNSNEMLKKAFEFKPTSRKDHFEFIMRGVNEKDQVFDIGSKVFPLDDINSQEEYLVQIVVPEMDNPNKIAAYINAKIILYMSDFKYYESLRKKQEKRLKKYMAAANKATEYLKYVREIYGDISMMKSELIVDFNNEKLMQRKGAKLNVNFNNMMEAEAPGGNYFVEFNNEKEVQTKAIPLRVEFHNSKEVLSPVTETTKYEYKYNYKTDVDLSKINELEKKIQLLEKEKEKISNTLANLPKTNLETINIKKTTENIKLMTNQNENIPNEGTNQVKIVKEQIKTTTVPQVNTNSQIIQQTITETKTQNISEPQYVPTQTTNEGTGEFVQQQTTETTETTTTRAPIYIQNQDITETNQNTILQSVNGNGQAFLNDFLSGQNATTTTTTTTTYEQNQYGGGQYQESQGIGYGTNTMGEVSEYETVGGILTGKTETSETHNLEPIVNQVMVNSSVNNAIYGETTNKLLVSENTLPVSYLPDKINEVIYENKVTTLPVITASTNPSYSTLQPIVHEAKTYYTGENNNITGFNYGDSNANGNIISNNYSSEYNYSSGGNMNYTGNYGTNGISDNNVNYGEYTATSNINYGDGGNWSTTQTTQTTTTQYNTSYGFPSQDSNYLGSQQMQYGV